MEKIQIQYADLLLQPLLSVGSKLNFGSSNQFTFLKENYVIINCIKNQLFRYQLHSTLYRIIDLKCIFKVNWTMNERTLQNYWFTMCILSEGLKKNGKFHFRGRGGVSRGHFPLFHFFIFYAPNGLKINFRH